ncbi:hypothetical protein VPBG_00148 [Vibrio phage helene 12B3]|uniref:hypothetical protein n=1 Tax=Vibrio phage helene 12B3 TaxID=573173 RepID=UPI0002C0FDDD|nr:hypothetical protein VPBG_00148 [Vibrio phage helene 12B3]YP_009223019.1 hypothetical protein VPLG_00170 [Vibrio phage eugene 12A10]AGG57920.1 hypothetical protein VPBG_00148 [Vibrio phage helene 12B3]AGN51609.1 hypothetical protein VPLG_00170 [Vibrio phage eugene 12A10]
MQWEDNEENYNGRGSQLVWSRWELEGFIQNFQSKLDEDGKKIPLTMAEELVLHSLWNLQEDYRRKENYTRCKEREGRYKEESQQLSNQLLEVTEERDSLREKVKEASIASGLFIQSVREKLGWEKKND